LDGRERDVHVYFDNDAFGHAPANALRLIALVSTDADEGVLAGLVWPSC
jgi:uncharacterized protein YecE (DUF72 family)